MTEYLNDRIEKFKHSIADKLLEVDLKDFEDHPCHEDIYLEVEEDIFDLMRETTDELNVLLDHKTSFDGWENDLETLDKLVEKMIDFQALQHIIKGHDDVDFTSNLNNYSVNLAQQIKEKLGIEN
ncbi:hypothetical protein [Enterococcus avium]|uniref:Uncharacterized protein n=1 Tax=Enterococcus avium TaxID=33945 RepID=A0ABD5F4L0_ENTAV|nr:hypothetical protein [Enterococcus avium]MDT2484009.1 hypothetical protein [Enterococcus avium]MDT2510565.1 hypothetical protein [Enterococcus avium]MDT2512856.1 hypothetical protein [Enterococcus avium]